MKSSKKSPTRKERIIYLDTIIHRYMFTIDPSLLIFRKPEITLIEILGRSGPMIMTEIAHQAMLSLSTATGLIDGLLDKGLVKRERSEEDRRIVRVQLTAEGQKSYEQTLNLRLAMIRGALRRLNKEERKQFVTLFRKILVPAAQEDS